MKGEVKNLSYSRFHNEWKWTFFCAERKKVCRGGLRILSAVLLSSFEPLSLPLITDNSVQRLNWNWPKSGSRRWFLQRWFFDHLAFSQVRVIGLVEFSSNCMDLSKVENDGNKIGTTTSFDLHLLLPLRWWNLNTEEEASGTGRHIGSFPILKSAQSP